MLNITSSHSSDGLFEDSALPLVVIEILILVAALVLVVIAVWGAIRCTKRSQQVEDADLPSGKCVF